MKRSLLILLSLFLLNCSSSEPEDEQYLGEGFFKLDGQTYMANNAHYFIDESDYLVISMSNGTIGTYGVFTKETKEHIWFVLDTESDPATLPLDNYDFPQVNNATPAWRIVAGALNTINSDSGDDYEGWVYTDDNSSFYADIFDPQLSGSLTLTKDGDKFSLDFSMPVLRGGQSLSGSYTGKIERITEIDDF